jgi:hypothetical protein
MKSGHKPQQPESQSPTKIPGPTSVADKLRQTISINSRPSLNTQHIQLVANMKNDAEMNKGVVKHTGKKRKNDSEGDVTVPISSKRATPSPGSTNRVVGIPLNLDSREAELRIQRKREKKARKKAERGANGD